MFNAEPPGFEEGRRFVSDSEDSDGENAPIHNVTQSHQRKNRWHHVQDLDSFFTRVYQYHQQHGLMCMALSSSFELIRFIFIVWFSTELRHCVDYSILFRDHDNEHVTLLDGLKNRTECHASIRNDATWVFFLLFAFIYGATQSCKLALRLFNFLDIKNFYQEALGITAEKLEHLSWLQIQEKLLDAQKLNQMCIHKEELTELDVHNRILRYKNYMIAMIDRQILPLQSRVPFLGELTFFTESLRINLEWLLFGKHLNNPWAPFSSFQLKPQYKRRACRDERAQDLSKRILILGLINLLAMPVVFIFQFMWTFFNYLAVVKREPGFLGMRKWSLYSTYALRHYNELNHQFKERLSRAIKPSNRYMESFVSYSLVEVAKLLSFLCSAVLGVFIILGIVDDDFFRVEHALSIMTLLGIVLGVTLSLIPDDFFVPLHFELLSLIRDHVHYISNDMIADPKSPATQKKFSTLFQMKLAYIIEELISPIVTPLFLIFKLRHRAPEIVDFLRQNTVEVQGVGDICKFALMENRRSFIDSQELYAEHHSTGLPCPKTDMSLVNFSVRHPKWKPPKEGQELLEKINDKLARMTNVNDRSLFTRTDPLVASLSPLESSLLAPQVPYLGTISENSTQSYTNKTQQILAQSMAAYHDLGSSSHRMATSLPATNNAAFEDSQSSSVPPPMAKSSA